MVIVGYSTDPIEMVVHQADSLTFTAQETIEGGEWEPTHIYELHAAVTLSENDAAQAVYVLAGIRTRRHRRGTAVKKPPYICRLHPRRDIYRRPYWLRTRSNPTRRNYH